MLVLLLYCEGCLMTPLPQGPKHREQESISFTRAALFTWGIAFGFIFGFFYTLACMAAAAAS